MTTEKEPKDMVNEEALNERANTAVIEHGVFAGLMLPISMLVGFFASWIYAYNALGVLGVLLNSIAMICIAIIGARYTSSGVDTDED